MTQVGSSPKAPTNATTEDATRILADARARCISLGLSPADFAALLLPEALLAMMVGGMQQEEVEEIFSKFAREEIPAWFLRVKRTVGYCDCAREAYGEHEAMCGQRTRSDALPTSSAHADLRRATSATDDTSAMGR